MSGFSDLGDSFAGLGDFVDARIVIIGIGGGGNNAVDRMISDAGIDDVTFVAMNTDIHVLNNSQASIKVQIGKKETKGLGAGAKPEVGAKSAEESIDEISQILDLADVVFITAGMGGGTGTGAAPIVAKLAKDKGILTIAVVSKPFTFEGKRKMDVAEEGIKKLKDTVDSLIIVPNNNIFNVFKERATIKDSFKKADEILTQSVKGIYDIIKKCGDINIDFADIRTIMSNRGVIHMGVGYGKGDDRFKQALAKATQNQLLETTIDGARAVLVQYYGDKLDMIEVSECGMQICEKADPNVELIFGTREPEEETEELRDFVQITIIAADFASKEEQANDSMSSTEAFGGAFGGQESFFNYSAPVAPAQPVNVAPAPVAPAQPQSAPAQNTEDDDIPSFLKGRR